jgi:hypothetical protein
LNTHVAIGLPTLDFLYSDFALSLMVLLMHPRDYVVSLINVRMSYIPMARSRLVSHAQDGRGATHIFFLDHDMTFPPGALTRLLSHDKDIVCATYAHRHGEPIPFGRRAAVRGGDLQEMERIPTGCLLIRLGVFDRLRQPYFRCLYDENTGSIMSDDYVFSDTVRALGYRIWCDPELTQQVGHLAQRVIKPMLDVPWMGERD